MKYAIIAGLVFAGMTVSANSHAITSPQDIPEDQLVGDHIDTDAAMNDAVSMCKMLGEKDDPSCVEVLHMDFYYAQASGMSYIRYNLKHGGEFKGIDDAFADYMHDFQCAPTISKQNCDAYKQKMYKNFEYGYMMENNRSPL